MEGSNLAEVFAAECVTGITVYSLKGHDRKWLLTEEWSC